MSTGWSSREYKEEEGGEREKPACAIRGGSQSNIAPYTERWTQPLILMLLLRKIIKAATIYWATSML